MTIPRLLLPAISLALVGCASTIPADAVPREGIKLEAARALLKWLTSGDGMPGWTDDPPAGASFVARAERLPVVCEFLPVDVHLTSDPRAWRSTEAELDDTWEEFGYDKTVYVWIRELASYRWSLDPLPPHVTLSIKYSFGNVGAHTYDVAFWEADGVLQCLGHLAGSS